MVTSAVDTRPWRRGWSGVTIRTMRSTAPARWTSLRLVAVLLLAAATALAGCDSGAPRASAKAAAVGPTSPNIFLINLDDARYDALDYLPKVRSWLASSRNYPSMHIAIPACCPSRGTLFTGRYSHNNGIRIQSQATVLDKNYTLMKYLKDA